MEQSSSSKHYSTFCMAVDAAELAEEEYELKLIKKETLHTALLIREEYFDKYIADLIDIVSHGGEITELDRDQLAIESFRRDNGICYSRGY